MSRDFGNVPIYPRRNIVSRASWEILEKISQVIEEHDLSYLELMAILTDNLKNWSDRELVKEWKRELKRELKKELKKNDVAVQHHKE